MEKAGVGFEELGGRFDPPVSRTTVWRWVKEPHRLNPGKIAALAHALGLDEPDDLWRDPKRPSIDALLRDAPDDLYQTAVDIVTRLTRNAS